MLRYKRVSEYFFMDTFFATKKSGKSSRGHTCCQLFVTDKGFVYVVPMRTKSEVLQAVKQFAKEIGAPDAIICDMSREQTSRSLRKFCGEIGTTLRVLEEGTPWANKAELYIGLIKEAVRKDMKDSNCPLAFWDYCAERRARINNMTAKDTFNLHGSNPHTVLTGDEGDISSLCQFGWYEWCYYCDHTEKFPFNKEVLGRILGPAKGEGNEMAQWVLKANGNVVPARINNMTAKDTFNLHGLNPHTVLTGDEGDISSLCQFGWYEWCYYRDHTEKFPFNKEVLGRILGPAKGEGNEMAQWVLKANGNVVPRRTARPLTVAENHSATELKKRGTFDALVEKRWGTSMSPPPVPKDDNESVFDEYEDDDEYSESYLT